MFLEKGLWHIPIIIIFVNEDLKMNILKMTTGHWENVKNIYKLGIATGIATFKTTAPTWDSWDKRHLAFGRLVAINQGSFLGWVALSSVSDRCVYGGVAEVSVYVHPEAKGKGVGQQLLAAAIAESEANGIWTINAAMFAENVASHKLHTKMGFRTVGYREKVGKQNGVWKDNILKERRSTVVI
jgi:L-amino acid N-acyltransferase YncA